MITFKVVTRLTGTRFQHEEILYFLQGEDYTELIESFIKLFDLDFDPNSWSLDHFLLFINFYDFY